MRICPFALMLFCLPWLSGCTAPEGASPEPEADSSRKTAEAAADRPAAEKGPRNPVVETDPRNPVVVRTEKFGNLGERELMRMQWRRARVLDILQEAALTALQGGASIDRGLMAALQQVFGTTTEESVVEGWLLARSAEDFGMRVSDESINAFLREFTANRLTFEQWKTVYTKHNLTERQLFDAIREELLATRFRQIFLYGQSASAAPPAQRWDYFTRLMRQATIEVLPVPVSRFVNEVPDPPADRLRKFFEEHRYNFARRDSPVPGFREPHKVNVQYFAANLQQFAATAVSEEDIKQHYQEHKAEYDRLETLRKEHEKSAEDDPAEQIKPPGEDAPEARPVPEPPHERQQARPVGTDNPSPWIRDRIRDELAQQKVEEAFARLQQKMKEYQTNWCLYRANLVDDPNAKPPKPLDFAALSKEHHLRAAETGLVSQWELAELDIGKAFTADYQPLAGCAFRRGWLPLYRSDIAGSFDFLGGCRYLFWKTQETKERVPTFDDEGVREQVGRMWKMVEARGPAKAAAEKLGAEARAAKKALKETFRGRPDIKVSEAGPFSWMTTGSVPFMLAEEPARLSQVEGVDRPGDAFMRAVFDLAPGEVGVAMNQPETEAYVIRMLETRPSDESLWASFETCPYRFYATAAIADQEQMQRAWVEAIKRSAGLKWQRPPDAPRDDEE